MQNPVVEFHTRESDIAVMSHTRESDEAESRGGIPKLDFTAARFGESGCFITTLWHGRGTVISAGDHNLAVGGVEAEMGRYLH